MSIANLIITFCRNRKIRGKKLGGHIILVLILVLPGFRPLVGFSKYKDKHRFVFSHGGIVRGDTASKVIHLVFTGDKYNDGGKHIRRTLQNHNIKAHFFFTGNFYRTKSHEQVITSLKSDGHYLGAHSDQHLLYATWEDRESLLVSKSEFLSDLENNYKEMSRFGISKENAPLFMPPYEWYNETISSWSKEFGLHLINFTPGTRSNADYTTPDMGKKYVSSETIYSNILEYEENSHNGMNGFILLTHIGTHPERKDKFYFKLDSLIKVLQKRGYKFSLLEI